MKVIELSGHCLLDLFSTKRYVTVIVPYGIEKVTPGLSEQEGDDLNRHSIYEARVQTERKHQRKR